MAMNTSKCNHLTPLHFKGLTQFYKQINRHQLRMPSLLKSLGRNYWTQNCLNRRLLIDNQTLFMTWYDCAMLVCARNENRRTSKNASKLTSTKKCIKSTTYLQWCVQFVQRLASIPQCVSAYKVCINLRTNAQALGYVRVIWKLT